MMPCPISERYSDVWARHAEGTLGASVATHYDSRWMYSKGQGSNRSAEDLVNIDLRVRGGHRSAKSHG